MSKVRNTDSIKEARAQKRHNIENLGAMGIPTLLVMWFGGELSGTEAAITVGSLGWMGSALGKFSSENELPSRLLKYWFPSLLALVVLTSGCAGGMVLRSTPVEVTAADSDLIVAHKVECVLCWSFWDGSIGANVEGGTGGRETVEVATTIVNGALAAVGGLFSGAGAAITPSPSVEEDE